MSERQSKVSRKRKMLSMENIEETKNKKMLQKKLFEGYHNSARRV